MSQIETWTVRAMYAVIALTILEVLYVYFGPVWR